MDMDGPARGWMVAYARKNFWRVASWYELPDLVQDGYMVYYRIADHYRGKIKSRSHIMSLFQISFMNHIHNLAKKKTRLTEVPIDDYMSVLIGSSVEDVSLLQMSLPKEVRSLLKQLTTTRGQRNLSKPYKSTKKGRETTNTRWCRLIGADPGMINMPQLVRASIKGA